jgi:hypothetical protein
MDRTLLDQVRTISHAQISEAHEVQTNLHHAFTSAQQICFYWHGTPLSDEFSPILSLLKDLIPMFADFSSPEDGSLLPQHMDLAIPRLLLEKGRYVRLLHAQETDSFTSAFASHRNVYETFSAELQRITPRDRSAAEFGFENFDVLMKDFGEIDEPLPLLQDLRTLVRGVLDLDQQSPFVIPEALRTPVAKWLCLCNYSAAVRAIARALERWEPIARTGNSVRWTAELQRANGATFDAATFWQNRCGELFEALRQTAAVVGGGENEGGRARGREIQIAEIEEARVEERLLVQNEVMRLKDELARIKEAQNKAVEEGRALQDKLGSVEKAQNTAVEKARAVKDELRRVKEAHNTAVEEGRALQDKLRSVEKAQNTAIEEGRAVKDELARFKEAHNTAVEEGRAAGEMASIDEDVATISSIVTRRGAEKPKELCAFLEKVIRVLTYAMRGIKGKQSENQEEAPAVGR